MPQVTAAPKAPIDMPATAAGWTCSAIRARAVATPAINSAGCTAAVECSASAVVEGSDIDAEDVARLLDRPRNLGMLRKMMKQALALGPLSREQEGDRHDTPSDGTLAPAIQGSAERRGPSGVRTSSRAGIAARSASDTPPRGVSSSTSTRAGAAASARTARRSIASSEPKPVILPEDQIKIA